MRLVLSSLVAVVCCATLSCEEPGGRQPPPATSKTASSVAPSTTTSASTSVAQRPRSAHEGRWVGTFEAKKSEVTVPKGVPYSTWDKDDGSARAGKCQIELRIDAAGSVRGHVKGALGELVATGIIDKGMLRVGLRPADPNAPNAMSGVLTGPAGNKAITGTLTVSNHDGSLARSAKPTLNHK